MTSCSLIGTSISDENSANIFRVDEFYNLKMETAGSEEANLFTKLHGVTSQEKVFKFGTESFIRHLGGYKVK